MALVLLVLVALFVLEIAVMVIVAKATSVIVMLLALVLLCAGGAWLVKRQGFATWRRINEGFARGEMPTNALLDGLIWVVAGGLLLLPGFVSDLLAVILILPPTRALLRPIISKRLQARASSSKFASAGGATFTTFGFNGAGGFTASSTSFDDQFFGRQRRVDDDIIDLDDADVFLDDPRGELGPGA